MAMRILKCTINGKPVEVGYDPRESLLDTLRDRLHLTGTKRGCEVGECGACTVLIDGVATDSCLYLTGKTYTRDEIRKQLSGHLCRCTGYENIVNAVEKAVDVLDGVMGEDAEKTA